MFGFLKDKVKQTKDKATQKAASMMFKSMLNKDMLNQISTLIRAAKAGDKQAQLTLDQMQVEMKKQNMPIPDNFLEQLEKMLPLLEKEIDKK